jgi:hypothetical protein
MFLIIAIKKPPVFRRLAFIIWLGMMESNHHKELQRLPHYHYANPQLQKNPLVIFNWWAVIIWLITLYYT